MKDKEQIKDDNRISFNDRSGIHEIDIDKAMDEYAEEYAKAFVIEKLGWKDEHAISQLSAMLKAFKESLKK